MTLCCWNNTLHYGLFATITCTYFKQVLCKSYPTEFTSYFHYCRSLRFEDKPDYSFLKRLFRDLFIREGMAKHLNISWVAPCACAFDMTYSGYFQVTNLIMYMIGPSWSILSLKIKTNFRYLCHSFSPGASLSNAVLLFWICSIVHQCLGLKAFIVAFVLDTSSLVERQVAWQALLQNGLKELQVRKFWKIKYSGAKMGIT